MPIFNYQAKDQSGNLRKGTIETTDSYQAARSLSKKGLIVISITEEQSSEDSFLNRIFHRVSFSAVVIMTRELSTMVESGLVLSEAIDILVEQEQNKVFKKILADISRDVKGGLGLASALKKHPEVFPPLYSNLVRAGEQSGKLDIVLLQMASNLERDREFRSRIRSAMIYPVLVITMMFVVMLVMVFFVIPRLTSLYTQSNIELPVPTRILIGTSNFFLNFWWAMLIVAIGGIIAFRRWIKTPVGKYYFAKFLLKVPVVSKIIQGSALTNFTRTFGLLTSAGVPILESLSIVSSVIDNTIYKQALEDSYKGVERGLLLSSQLENTKAFPRILTQMFKVGEETGKVDELSFKLADYFESETDHLVKNLTVIIEPVILVVLGVGVAFLVLSIILPIYKITTSIS